MADTTLPANVGSGGGAFAVDTISATVFPYTKMMWGPSGTANHVDTPTPLPVAGVGIAGTPTGGVMSIQGAASMTAVKTDGSAVTQPVTNVPSAANGLSAHSRISSADTNLVSVKAGAGRLYKIFATNKNASPRYLRIYNKVSAPVIASDSALIVFRIAIPGNTSIGGLSLDLAPGVQFSAGIAYDVTGDYADADATTISAGDVIVNLAYA